ncbi:MarR family winged helix-turn-helix transcriptional regulator [Cohnella soli]|uniref:MarR family winged helix-turn-helix transcriptional regulator n=1 Tax=Cohnella soli TaxID=425005 RepID=A0ABW0HT80_9BACL
MNDSFLRDCLFFTSNRLTRDITRLAEEQFATTGLSPSYGYLILLVNGTPGITQKELAEKLGLAPSTLTRFVDKLEGKRLVERKVQGKTVLVYPTDKSLAMEEPIRQASRRLHDGYEELLGKEASSMLSDAIKNASEQLNKR